MRKLNKLRLQTLEKQAKLYGARLVMLECEHEPTPCLTHGLDLFGHSYHVGWKLECHKCGKAICNLTEKEYLVACLERDEGSFLGRSNEMKERLAELEVEDAANEADNES